jgi:arylsulfatase A-like enzyme
MRSLLPTLTVCALIFATAARGAAPTSVKPNVVLFVVDGLGYSDLGCYGGEAQTHYLDYLANNGVRFSQAYSAGRGADTRMAMLSGYYPQHSSEGVVSAGRILPSFLKTSGYACYHVGMWDFAMDPCTVGFDHSLARVGSRKSSEAAILMRGGKPLAMGAAGAESFESMTSGLINFLQEHATQNGARPFFAYIALDLEDFEGALNPAEPEVDASRFHVGTDVLREERLERLWEGGLAAHAELSTPSKPAIGWTTLPGESRKRIQRAMALRTAAIARMDQAVGKVLEQVKLMGAWNQTIVLFTSSAGVTTHGEADKAQVASVANTPFRFWGETVFEGGIASPLIAHWPAGVKSKDRLREQVVHAIDLVPTILRLTGALWPKKTGDAEVPAADGVDASAALLENKALNQRALWWQVGGARAFRLGDWKWLESSDKTQELFYLRADRSETRDLAPANHERIKEMELQWGRMLLRFKKDMTETVVVQQKGDGK